MAEWLWLVLPVVAALGSSVISYCLMQSRLETAVAVERQRLAAACATVEGQKRIMNETIRATEEEARRRALDEFLSELHVEERRYVRERKMMFKSCRSLVLAERMFFRNIPLSSWVEHEMPVHEGADLDGVARRLAIFRPDLPNMPDLLPAPRGHKLIAGPA
jgi:hypothetical protein